MGPVADYLVNLSDCDSAIALHKARGYDDHDSAIIRVKRHRNSLLPISRLYQELLRYIFRLALPDLLVGCQVSPSYYYNSLSTLRQVSHIWEHEIVTAPLFWTLTSISLHPSFQDLIWERSGHAALEVRDRSFHHGSMSHHWTEAEKAYLARAMTREIRALCMTVPTAESLDPYIINHDHPEMRSLSLRGVGHLVCTRPLQMPRLTELQLISCSITWSPLHNLRSLSVSKTRGPNLAQFIQVLQSSPLLERLYLLAVITPPENPSNRAVIPLTPINLPQLSIIIIYNISFTLVSGILERLVPSATCRVSKIDVEVEQGLDLSSFCRHAGQICARGLVEQTTNPLLETSRFTLNLQLTSDRYLNIRSTGWNAWQQQLTMGRGVVLARRFFEGSKGISSTVLHGQFQLRVNSKVDVAEGLAIVQELFPETVELEVGTWERSSLEALEVLAEPTVEEEGNPVWRLPKLTVLKVAMIQEIAFGIGGFDYGGIVAVAIKRTQAAASSPSAVSPITLLKVGCETVSLSG
ncbi:hypothetical protein M407DRAFT_21654 [Tulasnella calospora MUT 4182]|uniref:F-box domain-containing protein n=1 Tax=Tulasnella calospora MUT 4182 TaxID=1051891 RepID=A0A0C3M6I6_9AGAM|nr:hypothetical protein M407DRAFT_21654 [Tulasnella calospora MUT 4182]